MDIHRTGIVRGGRILIHESCIVQPPDMEGILQQLNPPGEAKLAHGVRFVDLDGLVA